MRFTELTIIGNQAESKVISAFFTEYPRARKMQRNSTVILVAEEMSFLTSSSYTMIAVLNTTKISEKEETILELIGSGSGSGLLNIDFGKTRREIKRLYRVLEDLCSKEQMKISSLKIQKHELYYHD